MIQGGLPMGHQPLSVLKTFWRVADAVYSENRNVPARVKDS
jgi:hypothetical protein